MISIFHDDDDTKSIYVYKGDSWQLLISIEVLVLKPAASKCRRGLQAIMMKKYGTKGPPSS